MEQKEENWLNETVEKIASLNLEEEWKGFKMKELIEINLSEFSSISMTNRAKLQRYQNEAKNQIFWSNSFEDSIFSLNRICFVLHPKLVQKVKQDSSIREFLEETIKQKPTEAFKDVLSFLANKDIKPTSASTFRLPNLLLEHREEVLNDFANLVFRIHTRQKRGNGNSGRILLGPKGTGKSTFLQAFAIATSLLYDSIIVVFLDFSRVTSDDPVLPSQMLWYAYQSYTGNIDINVDSSNLDQVIGILRKNNLSTLIIADEFEKIFKWKDEKRATKVFQQFQAIGGSIDGVTTALISGSSAALHDLCFPNSSRKAFSKEDYPNYSGISLNHTRYKVIYSRPLRGLKSFRNILLHIIETSGSDQNFPFFGEKQVETLEKILNNEKRMKQLYEMTGGKFCNIQVAIDDEKKFLETLIREYSDTTKNAVFLEVARKLVEKCESNATEEDLWIESNEIDKELYPEIYLLGDQNRLFVEVTHSGPKITFEYLLQKEFCINSATGTVSLYLL